MASVGVAAFLPASGIAAQGSVSVYSNRTEFVQALAAAASSDDYQAYGVGLISEGLQLGEYSYAFDASATQPAVVAGGGGTQLLGGYPYDVFVGGDLVSLVLTVSNASNGDRLRGFGADFYFAPAYSEVDSNSYRITVGNGTAQGQYAGNQPLPGDGGVFFLGLIASPGAEFTSLLLTVVQADTNTIVPACQVDDLVYLKVRANPPLVTSFSVGQGKVALRGDGGMPGTVCYVRASPSVAQPLEQWPRVETNYFGADGSVYLSVLLPAGEPAQFYALEVP